MTIDDFNSLGDNRKKQILVDAEKVAEYNHDLSRYELFQINNFYVEVKTSFFLRYRKIINTCFIKDIPSIYASHAIASF